MAEYVDWFVNRDKQREGFIKLVERGTPKQVMLVVAAAEMGKTWLIQRLRHECRVRELGVSVVDFRDRRAWDYLSLVRQFRDQFGPAHFNELTEVINATTGVNVTVSSGSGAGGVDINLATDKGTVSDSEIQVGDVAGRDIIKDNFFFVQADSAAARRAIEIRITDVFFTCLRRMTAERVVVFLFDSYEDVTDEADRWIRTNLMAQIRDGLLPNVIVVKAGRSIDPPYDSSWRSVIGQTDLAVFEQTHVEEYIVQRRKLLDLDLQTILRTSGGHPGLLGRMADIAALENDDDEDDDWL